MDIFNRTVKKRSRVVNSQASASSLAISTDPATLEETAVQYERLPASPSPRHPHGPYSPTYGSSGNSDRFSAALGNLGSSSTLVSASAPSVYTGHASITPPVNLVAKMLPPDDSWDREKKRVSRAEGSNGSSRSRARSPSGFSIRSVTPSSKGEDRRRREEGLAASESSYRGDGRASVASSLSSLGDHKPLPPSPQRAHASNRAKSQGVAQSYYGDRSTLSSQASSQSFPASPSPYASTSSPRPDFTPRSDTRSQYTSSTSSTSAVPLFPRRGSTATTSSGRPSTIVSYDGGSSSRLALLSPSPHSANFELSRPASPSTIHSVFEELLPKLCPSAAMIEKMRELDVEKKWIMIYNESFNRWKAAREKLTHRPVDAGSAPAVGTSMGIGGVEPRERQGLAKARGKNEKPEWYVQKFLDGTISQSNVASLSVSLRTYELECVQLLLCWTGRRNANVLDAAGYNASSRSKAKPSSATLSTTSTAPNRTTA